MNSVLTVSELNRTVRLLLEQHIGQIWLSGEISNFSNPVSGHWYFTLKDQHAQVKCAMFKHLNQRCGFRAHNGQHVLVRASLSLYEPRGDYQLIIESMQIDGAGLLQLQFDELKNRLRDEGLFDPVHKKTLPIGCQQIGIITSSTGAALHDILNILKRRDPMLSIIIYPTLVQGKEASEDIVRKIQLANQRHECDVLIVGRGGGSLEDLWCFNEENVARAIFTSEIPIISAVGHETDITIADFVADLRAPTPSAAAELVSRDQQALIKRQHQLQQRLLLACDYVMSDKRHQLEKIRLALQAFHPNNKLLNQKYHLELFTQKMTRIIENQLTDCQYGLQRYYQKVHKYKPHVMALDNRLNTLAQQAQQQIERYLSTLQQKSQVYSAQLNAVSPLATLARGYSITYNEENIAIKNTQQIKVKQTIKTQLEHGTILSTVTHTTTQKS